MVIQVRKNDTGLVKRRQLFRPWSTLTIHIYCWRHSSLNLSSMHNLTIFSYLFCFFIRRKGMIWKERVLTSVVCRLSSYVKASGFTVRRSGEKINGFGQSTLCELFLNEELWPKGQITVLPTRQFLLFSILSMPLKWVLHFKQGIAIKNYFAKPFRWKLAQVHHGSTKLLVFKYSHLK